MRAQAADRRVQQPASAPAQEAFPDTLQERTFRYFWEQFLPATGRAGPHVL